MYQIPRRYLVQLWQKQKSKYKNTPATTTPYALNLNSPSRPFGCSLPPNPQRKKENQPLSRLIIDSFHWQNVEEHVMRGGRRCLARHVMVETPAAQLPLHTPPRDIDHIGEKINTLFRSEISIRLLESRNNTVLFWLYRPRATS